MKILLALVYIVSVNADLALVEPDVKHSIKKFILSNDLIRLHHIQYRYNEYFNNTLILPKEWFIGTPVSIAVLKGNYKIMEYLHNWKKINKHDLNFDDAIAIRAACKFGRLRILKYFKYHMNVDTETFTKYHCLSIAVINNKKSVTKWLLQLQNDEYYVRKYELTYYPHKFQKQYILENKDINHCEFDNFKALLTQYLYKHDIYEANNVFKLCNLQIPKSWFGDLIEFAIISSDLDIIDFIRKKTYLTKYDIIKYIPLICEYTNTKILHYIIYVMEVDIQYVKNLNCKEIASKYYNVKFNQYLDKYR